MTWWQRKILHRELTAAEAGSVGTLNELTPLQLEELRKLVDQQGEGLAVAYLRHVLRRYEADLAWQFVVDVVVGGADARTWGVADVLVRPEDELITALRRTAGDVLAALDGIDGERWWRVRPVAGRGWDDQAGGPGVLLRSVPYWRRPVHGALSAHQSIDDVERIEDPVLEWRRALAARSAFALRGTEVPPTVDIAAQAVGADPSQLSDDGVLALRGLLFECRGAGLERIPSWQVWRDEAVLPLGYRAADMAYA